MAFRSVLIFAPSAYPLGGVADWLDALCSSLAVKGVSCKLALVEGGGHDVARYVARHPWHDFVGVKNTTGSRQGRINALLGILEAHHADITIVVNLVDVYEAFRRFRFRNRATNSRLVVALHGIQADLIEDIRTEADVIDGVIATNKLAAALAAEALNNLTRAHYAPCGVPLRPLVAPSSLNLPVLKVLYAGRIEQEQKRVLDLPLIIAALRSAGTDARLSIAGAGPEEVRLRAAFAEHGMEHFVSWLGDLEKSQLAEAYRKHDVLLVTSAWETGPIVAWEAMSHGLPVVSSRYVGSGLERALSHGQTAVLFEVGDVEAAAKSIEQLRDPSFRCTIAAGGYSLIRRRYGLDTSAAAWHDALSAVFRSTKVTPLTPRVLRPSGRLDRVLGAQVGEAVRKMIGMRKIPTTPGSAWPHSYACTLDQESFLERARESDRLGL